MRAGDRRHPCLVMRASASVPFILVRTMIANNRKRPSLLSAIVCLWLVFLALAGPAGAKKREKPSRTVAGEVLDASDHGIDGATVELKDLRTGKTLAIYTQQGGKYSFRDLQAGDDYQVLAHYKGQSSETRTASSFDNRDLITLNLHIPPPAD